ncbi:MAG: hypothetical protein R8M38_08070 [Mariprofundaceae bacterium]
MPRNKHKGLAMLALLGVAFLIGTLIYTNGRSIDAAISGYKPEVPAPLRSLAFDQQEFVQLGRLTEKVTKLAHPPKSKARDVRFAILDGKSNQRVVNVTEFVQVKPFDYKVSMVFISEKNRYAVVDGKFVHVGDRLRNGGVVKAIRKGKVRISRGDRSRWIKVRMPHAKLGGEMEAKHVIS